MATLPVENLIQRHSKQLVARRAEPARVEALLVDCADDSRPYLLSLCRLSTLPRISSSATASSSSPAARS
eukprot:488245-Rhodomonas_salina.1